MFNIVLNGDSVSRQYAVDLFGDLLKNQNIQHSLTESVVNCVVTTHDSLDFTSTLLDHLQQVLSHILLFQ